MKRICFDCVYYTPPDQYLCPSHICPKAVTNNRTAIPTMAWLAGLREAEDAALADFLTILSKIYTEVEGTAKAEEEMIVPAQAAEDIKTGDLVAVVTDPATGRSVCRLLRPADRGPACSDCFYWEHVEDRPTPCLEALSGRGKAGPCSCYWPAVATRWGRTVELLYKAAETGGTIICATDRDAMILKARAKAQELDVKIVVSDGKLHGNEIHTLSFDSRVT